MDQGELQSSLRSTVNCCALFSYPPSGTGILARNYSALCSLNNSVLVQSLARAVEESCLSKMAKVWYLFAILNPLPNSTTIGEKIIKRKRGMDSVLG